MDDLTVAKWCAKALRISSLQDTDSGLRYGPRGALFSPLTDPAIAFRLESWLLERGLLDMGTNWINYCPYSHRRIETLTEHYTTPESRCAAVARLVARVMGG